MSDQTTPRDLDSADRKDVDRFLTERAKCCPHPRGCPSCDGKSAVLVSAIAARACAPLVEAIEHAWHHLAQDMDQSAFEILSEARANYYGAARAAGETTP